MKVQWSLLLSDCKQVQLATVAVGRRRIILETTRVIGWYRDTHLAHQRADSRYPTIIGWGECQGLVRISDKLPKISSPHQKGNMN